MNEILLNFQLGAFNVVITPWKLVGYLGLALFTSRWVVQLVASRRAGRPTLPRAFWYMSVAGSVLLLGYFTFGKNDSVGVLANLFPLLTASYNLWLDLRAAAVQTWARLGRGGPAVRDALVAFGREVAALVRRRRGQVGAALCATLALAVALHGLDQAFLAWNLQHREAATNAWARQLSWWGELHRAPLLILLAAAGFAVWRARKDAARLLLAGVAAGVAAGILVNLMKVIVGRPRPSAGLADGFYWFRFDYAYQGFPSGHAAHCFAIVGALSVFAPRWAAAAGLGALAVAWARFSLDRHYLTDLVAGAGLGLTVGVVCALAARRMIVTATVPQPAVFAPALGRAPA
jgi:undecaprenyl-diphosphatase